MNALLDTHSFLWFLTDNPRLGASARTVIMEETTTLFLSIVSLWEMAIKVSIGKLVLAEPLAALIPEQLRVNDITPLGVNVEHAVAVAKLPFHHRDPFDRLLVA